MAKLKLWSSWRGKNSRDSVAADRPSPSPSSPKANSSRSTSSSRASTSGNPKPIGRPPSYGGAAPTTIYQRSTSPLPAPLTSHPHYASQFGAPPQIGPIFPSHNPSIQQPPQYPYVTPTPPAQGLAIGNINSREEVEVPASNQTQLIVGVDFGTTYSGVAFALITGKNVKDEIITEWPGCGTDAKQKISTIIRYDKNTSEIVSWGELQEGLNHIASPLPDINQQKYFKLYLDPEGSYHDMVSLKPVPPGKTPINIISDYLRELRLAAAAHMRKTLGELYDREEPNIKYFLTVPAIWNDRAKAGMRLAAVEAGFVENEDDRRLSLVSEPEAAAMFCARSGFLKLKRNDAILIVDCGGGTVDLIAYQVEEESPLSVSECTPGSGALLGSGWLNHRFLALVQRKVNNAGLDKQPRVMGKILTKCLAQFDSRIKGNFKDNGTTHICDVGLESDYPLADIEEGQMKFTNDEILSCFHPIVSEIEKLVRDQIQQVQARSKNLSNILLIGGFGASNYLFEKLKASVPPQYSNKVVRPMDSVAAIVRGAVTAGITERLVTCRVARRHYLMSTLQPFVEGVHREEYRTPSLDGKDRCSNCHNVWVHKGDRLNRGHTKTIPLFRLVQAGASLIYEDILYVCDEDVVPQYITDPAVKEYCTLVSDLSSMDLERDFETVNTPHGTFYRVTFEVKVQLDGTDLVAEAYCKGAVRGRCIAKFR